MTARVGPTFKVPVSSELKLSGFSQYPAIVSRSMWEPIAPGISRDLVGRVVIFTAVLLVGYLILALFSRYFWHSTPPPAEGTPRIGRAKSEEYVKSLNGIAQSVSKISLERLYGPKNSSDICTKPHTHLSVDQAIFFFNAEKQLVNICYVNIVFSQ